jgi:hypothetical protein
VSGKTCFVIGPIGDEGSDIRRHADWVLDGIINPVLTAIGMPLGVRADRITSPGMIDSQVINNVLDADLVIADLTTQNPNVFYELGLRHREEKPIIHLVHQFELKQLPFDIAPFRTVPVSWGTPKELDQSRDLLREHVQEATAEGHEVENPVTRARGRQRLKETASPSEQVLLEDMAILAARVAELERREAPQAGMFADIGNVAVGKTMQANVSVYPPPLTLVGDNTSVPKNLNGRRAVLIESVGLGGVIVSVEGQNTQLSLSEWISLPAWHGP